MTQPQKNTNRRIFLKQAAAFVAATGSGMRVSADEQPALRAEPGYKRIATEEAFITNTIAAGYDRILRDGLSDNPGFNAMWRGIGSSEQFRSGLLDLGEGRIADMDAAGISLQLLLLTAPGVQVFDAATATALARATNDELQAAIAKYPDRYAGLAVIAPQDPKAAARELERGVNSLGLNGAVVNSHTFGEYLDDQKHWEIFEAADSLDAPIYIHPRPPPPPMIEPYLSRGLSGPLGGFSAEVYLHTLAIITAGAFDRFPGLKIVIGHLGEGLPYLMYRLDYMQHHAAAPGLRGRAEPTKLKRKISDYITDNIYITTSGMAWEPAIKFAQSVMGSDHVLYAMDYPYQFDIEEVIATDNLSISDHDKRLLYQLNAERLFSLKKA
jgi:2,3-dihydroxybenzoate decarboxylase